MPQISKAEYEKRKQEYWTTEYGKAEVKPNGMAGSWSFRLQKEREFDELLKKEGLK